MEKICLKSYPPGMPETVNADTYRSLNEGLESYYQQFRDHSAFVNFSVSVNYNQLDQLSRDFSAYLQKELKKKENCSPLYYRISCNFLSPCLVRFELD